MNQTAPQITPKNHYEILDGLRGIAAILVVMFHVFEAFNFGNRFVQIINHGYLAVDFFFLLSGFVVAYAYDDRWEKMTSWDFYKRRLIRLQPMVIMGTIIGAALFYLQQADIFPLISGTPLWKLLLVMLVGFTLIPLPISMDIRGWQEMHTLDGPCWSLFFEYIANILYAIAFRKFSKTVLSIFVFLFACLLVQYLVWGGKGDVIGGWTFDKTQIRIGFTRMLFPFFGGLLLSRTGKLIRIKGAFWICSLLLLVIFCIPRIGNENQLWMNGLYESFCIIILFPIIVAIGAGGSVKGKHEGKANKFLGELSYPLYLTHYPLIYLFTAWVTTNHVTLTKGLPVGALLLVTSIAIAYACLKLYDEPVRKWLANRFLTKREIKH